MNAAPFLLTIAGALFGQQPSGAVNVAVISLPDVSERYIKTSALEAQFEQRRKQLNEKRDAMNEKIERLKRSLQEELKPGTEAYAQRQKELAMQQAELQWFMDAESQNVERGLAEALRSIYEDIRQMVAQVAKERDLDIVLASDALPPQPPTNANQVRQQILLQKVIYWQPRVDITDVVVDRLNAAYKASPAGTSK
jgi:Skp family chaperone for outer membrane proteins